MLLINDDYIAKPCVDISLDDKDLKKITIDMMKTILDHNGTGLAAPQIGVYKNVIVFLNDEGILEALYNPVIICHSSAKICSVESCLSFPGKVFKLKRWKEIICAGIGEDLKPKIIKAKKRTAIIIQHEIGHLRGERI
jgi:peptide deformylase